MDPGLILLILFAALGWGLVIVLARAVTRSRADIKAARSSKTSLATKHGMRMEQFAPWLAKWPFRDAGAFRFVGDPIDGIQFEEDAVFLVEIKTEGQPLKPRQKQIRDAVLAGRVGWVTFGVRDGRAVEVLKPWER